MPGKKILDYENYWITKWPLKGRNRNSICTALGIGLLVKFYSFSELTALTFQQQSQIIHGSTKKSAYYNHLLKSPPTAMN